MYLSVPGSLSIGLQPQTPVFYLPELPAFELATTPAIPLHLFSLRPPSTSSLPSEPTVASPPFCSFPMVTYVCALCMCVGAQAGALRLTSRIFLASSVPHPVSQVFHSNTERTDLAPANLTGQLAALGSPCCLSRLKLHIDLHSHPVFGWVLGI